MDGDGWLELIRSVAAALVHDCLLEVFHVKHMAVLFFFITSAFHSLFYRSSGDLNMTIFVRIERNAN